jgi:hypothetical protein
MSVPHRVTGSVLLVVWCRTALACAVNARSQAASLVAEATGAAVAAAA